MNKNIFLFLSILLCLSTISAWSYSNSDGYGDSKAYAQVSSSNILCEGILASNYCIGKWYIDTSFEGTTFYMQELATSWPSATKNGYPYMQTIQEGRIYLNSPVNYFILCAHDYDKAINGDWSWTSICGGFLGNANFDKLVTACTKTTGCDAGFYCDYSSLQNAKCLPKECESGEEKCVGVKHSSCVNYKWVSENEVIGKCGINCLIGQEKCNSGNYTICMNYIWIEKYLTPGKCGIECLNNQEKCDNFVSYSCTNNKWKNEGILFGKCNTECSDLYNEKCDGFIYSSCKDYKWVSNITAIGKCGVECISNIDCSKDNVVSTKCTNGNIVTSTIYDSCKDNKCLNDNLVKTEIGSKCSNDLILTNTSTNPLNLIIISITSIFIIAVTYYQIKRKSKRKHK